MGDEIVKEEIDIKEKDNEQILEKIKQEREIENKIIENIFKFDYKAIEKIIEKNEIKNIQLLSYFYFLKGDYDLAKEKLKENKEEK